MIISAFKSSKAMSPLDRIAQLNQEVAELKEAHAAANRLLQLEKDTVALLRSQLKDGQEQAKRDSATIAQQAHDIKGLSNIAADSQRTKDQALEALRNLSLENMRLEAELSSIPST